jgi:ribosomal protein S18 acetylase RimI-like enzyme
VIIHRATLSELDAAYGIVSEYCEAIGVMVRDDRAAFEREYFGEGGGLWTATIGNEIVGCIGLHALSQGAGEIKRLYVRTGHRGQGIAEALLAALEDYAVQHEYRDLYLDSKDDLLAAIRFYRRHGYQECERYNDNPQATIFMRKRLA